MNKERIKELRRSIAEIENPYPKDDLIMNYSDFLKIRDFLRHYQFNPIVFNNLLKLANDEWKSGKRINRLSLLQMTKRYLHVAQKPTKQDYHIKGSQNNITLSLDTRIQMFELFKKSIDDINNIHVKQIEEVSRICNNILINIELTEIEEEWLCHRVEASNHILNRILRYPSKSKVISKWAKDNFKNDKFRIRRAELVAWILDEEPDFVIDRQTLIDDFEYLNKYDSEAIKIYEDEVIANKIIESELGDFFPKKRWYGSDDFDSEPSNKTFVDISEPELNLARRFYPIPIDSTKEYPLQIPDYDKLKLDFYDELKIIQKITMIWSITYSRLDNKIKSALLKKYYCDETYYSMYKVGKRTKNTELLGWILEKQ